MTMRIADKGGMMSISQQQLGLAAALPDAPERAEQAVTWRQWYMAGLLTLLYIYAQIDGSAIIILVTPIKQDLGVTDTQMSLLLGLSFAAFYSILGLPAGYLVDRMSRRKVMGVGIVLWSAMTMSCGLAQTYSQLFLARCGVGIGEASITPASYSLIRDAFPPNKRGKAFGMFSAGSYIGAALAVMITGALLGTISAGALKNVPWIGGLRPWQAVLVLVGMIGFPLSLLLLTFREPARLSQGSADAGVRFAEALAHLIAQWRTYLPLAAWVTCFFGVAISYGSWMPTIIGRTWHLAPTQIGLFFGGALLICAPIGAWCGGAAIDTLRRRGRHDAAELVGLWITILFIPFGVAAPIVPEVGEMFFALAAQLLFAGAYQPVGASLLAQITPQRLMGKVTAIYLLVFTLLGRGFGPTIVALISDNFYTGPQALGFALGTAAAVLMTIALVMIALLLRRARRGVLA
jgi:MFS family permease